MRTLIAHRVNTIKKLRDTPRILGVEVDIRSDGSNLIIHHEPFSTGVMFDDWLAYYEHRTLILNVKEEGLEPYLIERMRNIGCDDYFFLDQSFPFLVRFATASKGRAAVRFSEYESIDTVLALAGKVNWVWVDCFTKLPLRVADVNLLKEAGFKLCLVSPELQGRESQLGIPSMHNELTTNHITVDAICTKYPDLWAEQF